MPSVRYESVTWDRASYENTGYLYCNGLLIGDIAKPASNLIISGHDGGIFSLNAPTISLVDNNGLLPVDLARKGLSRAEKELSSSILRSIVEEFVAFLFQIEAESPSEIIELWNKRRHRFQSSYHQPFLFGSEGFCIMDKWLLHCINPSRLIVEVAGASIVETQQRHKVLDEKTLTVIRGYGHGAEGSRSATVDALRDIWGPWDVNSLFERRYMVLRKDTFEDVFKLKSLPNYFHNMRNAGRTVEIKGDKYVIVSRSSPLNASFVKEIGNLIMKTTVISDKSWRLRGDIRIFEGYHKTAFPSKTIFSEVWEESFSSVCLPYDAKQRAKLLRENAPLKAHL